MPVGIEVYDENNQPIIESENRKYIYIINPYDGDQWLSWNSSGQGRYIENNSFREKGSEYYSSEPNSGNIAYRGDDFFMLDHPKLFYIRRRVGSGSFNNEARVCWVDDGSLSSQALYDYVHSAYNYKFNVYQGVQ